MKALVFLLVFANLLFYAFGAGYFGHPSNPDAGRVEQQVVPERMRIVSRGEAPATTAAPVKAPPEPELAKPEVDAAPVGKEEIEAPAKEATLVKAPVCLAWRQLAQSDADRLASLLGKRFGGFKLSRKTQPGESSGWWVYISPQPGKAEADKKAGDLRELGIKDFFVIQEGPNRFGISLGIFSAEKGAQDRLAELKAKGVRSALAGPRPGKENLVSLQARGPAADRSALLAAVGEALPKAEAVTCK